VDKAFKIALAGKVGKKVQVMSKIINSLCLTRFGEEEVIKPATSGKNQDGLYSLYKQKQKIRKQLRNQLISI